MQRAQGKGDGGPWAGNRPRAQGLAACLKAVSLSFGKEGLGGPTKGAAGKGRQGSAWDRARQVQAARWREGRGLQQAFSAQPPLPLGARSEGSSRKWSWFPWFPGTWSFLALPAHGAGTLHPAEPTDPALTRANPFPQPG